MTDLQLAYEIEMLPYRSKSPVPWRDWTFYTHTRTGKDILAGDFRHKSTGRKRIASVDKETKVPMIFFG